MVGTAKTELHFYASLGQTVSQEPCISGEVHICFNIASSLIGILVANKLSFWMFFFFFTYISRIELFDTIWYIWGLSILKFLVCVLSSLLVRAYVSIMDFFVELLAPLKFASRNIFLSNRGCLKFKFSSSIFFSNMSNIFSGCWENRFAHKGQVFSFRTL